MQGCQPLALTCRSHLGTVAQHMHCRHALVPPCVPAAFSQLFSQHDAAARPLHTTPIAYHALCTRTQQRKTCTAGLSECVSVLLRVCVQVYINSGVAITPTYEATLLTWISESFTRMAASADAPQAARGLQPGDPYRGLGLGYTKTQELVDSSL